MNEQDWKEFHDKTKDKPPRDLIQHAVKYVPNPSKAIDIGGGGLRDTKFLLNLGFEVTVVDSSPNLTSLVKELNNAKLHFSMSKFDEFDYKNENYDLVNAMCALPFNGVESFNQVFESIKKSLKVGGVLSANLYGVRDCRNVEGTLTVFHTKDEVESLLKGMEILHFKEDKTETGTDAGVKHWHVFYFIVRRIK